MMVTISYDCVTMAVTMAVTIGSTNSQACDDGYD